MPFDCRFCGQPLDRYNSDECSRCQEAAVARGAREKPAREAMRAKVDQYYAGLRAKEAKPC